MEDEDMEDLNRPMEETCTIGQGSLSTRATHSPPDGRLSIPNLYLWTVIITLYLLIASQSSISTSNAIISPAGTVYTTQHGANPSASCHDTPFPPIHVLPAQHGTIPFSSHHSQPSPPPGYVYPHEHGAIPSSSHYATPSSSAHLAHSLGKGDEHTSTSHRPPARHRASSTRSSTNKLRLSIPPLIEEILDFFRPPTAPTEGENPLIHLIVEDGLLEEMSTQSPNTSIDEDAVYLEVCAAVAFGIGFAYKGVGKVSLFLLDKI
ncbi:hypothetical protein Sjap_018938 [Stephania japonica]|uniref:Uncharacterized protein n=1 Tax=Stephania japonica TaxID=461633 RepID=A0AAP0HZ87_9MAGN